jgi:hypothetical protein
MEVRIRCASEGRSRHLCEVEFDGQFDGQCGEQIIAALKLMGGVYVASDGASYDDLSYQVVLDAGAAYLEIIVQDEEE